MGKCNEALEIHYQVDKLRTDTLGINHPSTLCTKCDIANCLNDRKLKEMENQSFQQHVFFHFLCITLLIFLDIILDIR